MKFSSALFAWLAIGIPGAFALPGPLFEQALDEVQRRGGETGLDARASQDEKFNAKDQYVSNTGAHKFIAPGKNDVRGPCPGLNVMANHGYLPRNGFATVAEFITACTSVFRMGKDLAAFLAAYGAAMDGVGAGWEIGGTKHIGIGGSHNNYETDSSPLRADLHQYGSNTELIMEQFYELYNLQPDPKTANYNLEVMRHFRYIRFNESVAKNPYFYYGPFSGAVVSQAAYTFIYRFMANKSAEHPEGWLDKNVLKSFMSISGPEHDLKWKPGYERIPDNWYTRPSNSPYNISYLSQDFSYVYKGHPYISHAGCNHGKVNSYVRINPSSDSGKPVTETNPLCIGLATALQTAQKASGLVTDILEGATLEAQNALGCSTVPKLNETASKACPGYSMYGGPRGKVAPGAIQN